MRRATKKQKEFSKLVIKGVTPTKAAKKVYDVNSDNAARVIASQNLDKPIIQSMIEGALKRHNINLDRAVKPISKALDAKKQIVTDTGIIETDIDDLDMQLKGSDRALKLMGVGQGNSPASQTFIQINQQHLNKYLEEDN